MLKSRRLPFKLTSALLLLATLAAPSGAALAQAGATEQALSELPYTPSLDRPAMDMAVDPCEDFYQYACGGWIKHNPIPADQSRWSVYAKLANENQRFLWGILDKLATAPDRPALNPKQVKMGDYFAACMNEDAAASQGLRPLRPLLDKIDALADKRDLPALLAALHLATNNERLLFRLGAGQDFGDSAQVIAFAMAAGLSLPDRDYYLSQDAKSRAMMKQFEAHVARIFELGGDSPQAAARAARSVVATERALARATLTQVQRRDPYKTYHKLDAKALQALTPNFDWTRYLHGLGLAEAPPSYNVTEPAFFKALDKRLHALSLAELRDYLRWATLSSHAAYLGPDMVQANFDFFGQTLHGTPQLKPRWKRCVELVDAQLGEALGEEFVQRSFGPELKQQTLRMTAEIETAMAASIQALPWMSDATKRQAQAKLASIVNKVGYPERWRDYSAMAVDRSAFVANVQRGHDFEFKRQLAKIGRPLDRGEWAMTPQTVNAYYDAQMNDINFPAAVLQPPLFDPKMDAAPNYGNTGGTISHELVHGFDDEGRKFDAQGNLKDWWTKKDGKAFERRAACVAQQYAGYTIVDDIKINSQLTLGEDLADLGGLVLALSAWQQHTAGQRLSPIDGLTPEQRFFIGFAQWDCNSERPEAQRVQALTNPHSPGRYRINGVVVNMAEFAQAFACKPGQAMVKPEAKRCKIW